MRSSVKMMTVITARLNASCRISVGYWWAYSCNQFRWAGRLKPCVKFFLKICSLHLVIMVKKRSGLERKVKTPRCVLRWNLLSSTFTRLRRLFATRNLFTMTINAFVYVQTISKERNNGHLFSSFVTSSSRLSVLLVYNLGIDLLDS